ncbi:MAG: DNA adenine methylase, partial [Flavobacterium sp.]|nr:DNA adenine methylase [Flavobacterium sp.]
SIAVESMDALDLIDYIQQTSNDSNTIFYFDPPYYLKGSFLYMNYYRKSDHNEVAQKIKQINTINWVVSYDNHEVIKNIYYPFKPKEYSFNHSANKSKIGQEVLFFSSNLLIPVGEDWNPTSFKLSRKPNTKKILYLE